MKARNNKGIGTQLISLVGGIATLCGVTLCSVPMAQAPVQANISPAVSSCKAPMVRFAKEEQLAKRFLADTPLIAMANGIRAIDR